MFTLRRCHHSNKDFRRKPRRWYSVVKDRGLMELPATPEGLSLNAFRAFESTSSTGECANAQVDSKIASSNTRGTGSFPVPVSPHSGTHGLECAAEALVPTHRFLRHYRERANRHVHRRRGDVPNREQIL